MAQVIVLYADRVMGGFFFRVLFKSMKVILVSSMLGRLNVLSKQIEDKLIC